MKTIVVRFIAICVCFAFVCMNSAAQDETIAAAAGDRYLISAKAGGVNFVAGTVSVVRKEGKSGALLKGDTLQIGDRVSTGPDGKAEILLNPGSFLRLGGNSAFKFKTTSLEDLQLKIQSGSAIFEVFAANDFQVSVSTPKTDYLLIETGVYRVDVLGGGDARLEVWKGAARIPNSVEIVKTGRVANVRGSGGFSITKFDRGEKDALDIWSKARGKELARISALLKRGNLRTTLMQSFLGRRWNMYGSFGLWVYDPFFGGYCFLPFGYGWNSPYGFGYGNYIGWYDLPPVIYYPPHTGGGNSGGGTNTPTITPIVSAGDRSPVPPFVRMQETMGGGRGGDRGGDRGGSSYDPGSSSPSYSPAPSSSSSSSPAPTKSDSPPPAPTKQP
jgi:hypothetical protein